MAHRTPIQQRIKYAVLPMAACVLASLAGCNAAMKPVRAVGLAQKDLVLQVTVEPDANDSSPVAIDVVAIDNKKTAGEVAELTSTQWFAKRGDLLRMKGKQISVQSWEWVPGETVPDVHVLNTTGKDAVLLFARYSTKGEHRALLPALGVLQLDFAADDFRMSGAGIAPAVADAAADPSAAPPPDGKKKKAPKPPKLPKAPKAPKLPKVPKLPPVPDAPPAPAPAQ